MPVENEYVGREEVGTDSYLGPTKYRIRCKCLRCGKEYSKIVSRLTDDNPPCPRKACKDAIKLEERIRMEANIRAMIEAERGPVQIGNNHVTRAVDMTAEIVMKDHRLTNLKDNIREGESMVPSLPPKMQEAADNFFSPQARMPSGRRAKQMELLGRRAMAGAFRDMAINPSEITGTRRPGERALIKTGEERLK